MEVRRRDKGLGPLATLKPHSFRGPGSCHACKVTRKSLFSKAIVSSNHSTCIERCQCISYCAHILEVIGQIGLSSEMPYLHVYFPMGR